MPTGIPHIIGNEAAERFSFYGMRGILVIFMSQYLHLLGAQAGEAMPKAEAIEKFHIFVAAVYFTPFLGGLLADAFFGTTTVQVSVPTFPDASLALTTPGSRCPKP